VAAPAYLTVDVPGVGGVLKARPEDFEVEEVPAYLPAGEGDHAYAWIEKVDLTTPEAIRRMAQALGVRASDVGSAGLKDRHAITRQWLSFPPPTRPEALTALSIPGVRVLRAARHRNKLRTGHLRGNRFRLVIRDLAVPADEGAARASRVLAALSSPPGLPNWYGEQRFGMRGDNAARGRALLRGEPVRPPVRDGREKRLLLSAWQSELFNQYLKDRMADGALGRVLTGDLLMVVASGGIFATTDPAADQVRVDQGEIVPTGPMFGSRMPAPPPGSEAAAREVAILAAEHLTSDMTGRHGLLSGTRRPLAVRLHDAVASEVAPSAISITFTLPAGSYATIVAAEVMKTDASLQGPSCS
jgi:tRNA pseudouridine13 synthase